MGLKLKLMIFIMLSSFIVAGWYYVKSLQAEVKAAEQREATYKGVIDAKNAETDAIRRDLNSISQQQKKLAEEVNNAKSNVNNLEKKFSQDKQGKERSIRSDAISNPKAVEDAINRGTKDALRCGELSTGSPLTEDEKSGKVKIGRAHV